MHSFVLRTCVVDCNDEPLGDNHVGVIRDHKLVDNSPLIMTPKFFQEVDY